MASPISAASAYAKLARLADPGANLGKAAGNESGGHLIDRIREAEHRHAHHLLQSLPR